MISGPLRRTGVLDDVPGRGRAASLSTQRRVAAGSARVWTQCTTKRGLESWWAPEGIVLTVEAVEVRTGGRIEFQYEEAAAARDPRWKAEVEAKGQGTSWTARGTFTVVEPDRRLEFRQRLDFGRGRPLQDYRHFLEFRAEDDATVIVSRAEAPASKQWSLLGMSNLIGQLERLERSLLEVRTTERSTSSPGTSADCGRGGPPRSRHSVLADETRLRWLGATGHSGRIAPAFITPEKDWARRFTADRSNSLMCPRSVRDAMESARGDRGPAGAQVTQEGRPSTGDAAELRSTQPVRDAETRTGCPEPGQGAAGYPPSLTR